MRVPEQFVQRFAGSRLGRIGVTWLVGAMTVQAVTQLRGILHFVDIVTGRDEAPCAGCLERQADGVSRLVDELDPVVNRDAAADYVVDEAAPQGPGLVDGSSPFAGDELLAPEPAGE